MARIKHTKSELKTQRDAQRRYERYLPILQLKKQQLLLEIRTRERQIREKREEEEEARDQAAPWIKLFSESFDLASHLHIKQRVFRSENIAGVTVPVLENIQLTRDVPDLVATPTWIDDGLRYLETLARNRIEREALETQHVLLTNELRVTTQRVNLFEKVKIPESKENIRVIRVFLGDMQIAGVARAKIAKAKFIAREHTV